MHPCHAVSAATTQHPPVWSWASDAAAQQLPSPPHHPVLGRHYSPSRPDFPPSPPPYALDRDLLTNPEATAAAAAGSPTTMHQRFAARPASAALPQALPYATERDPPAGGAEAAAVAAHRERQQQYVRALQEPDRFGRLPERRVFPWGY
jgi:hypothetical protein